MTARNTRAQSSFNAVQPPADSYLRHGEVAGGEIAPVGAETSAQSRKDSPAEVVRQGAIREAA